MMVAQPLMMMVIFWNADDDGEFLRGECGRLKIIVFVS
jgi:hypothetical protein